MNPTRKNRSIAVFCGARPGTRQEHLDFARDFGTSLARHGLGLVYGAGGVGIMRAVADGVLEHGGDVTGVIPRDLHERERADHAPGAVFLVRTMHERKALMYRLASGFAVLPGGLGTLDELMEVATWNQLSLLAKPVVVLNRHGFYDPMLAMLDHLVVEGFLAVHERRLIQVAETAEEALCLLGAGNGVLQHDVAHLEPAAVG
ncbi:TIGR00730 family Rossman fold protein [Streptomyces minutiscleroticus]|uniref:Cytokinin riboside 5'-monophosphate phosphoribohydrolase n=1 Tax=Streptomyces minutiscleroticus TaxID=68238 RepID=A0A918U1N1_9ACTN|nr:TIGR00730 family Rossman fold protein [Streptomyces minutiscleroticus]GGX80174.1 putative cytokinin riboside 5'-monophosphate phosphoribohydrolase [Streptomyces minutiscleroticus]